MKIGISSFNFEFKRFFVTLKTLHLSPCHITGLCN